MPSACDTCAKPGSCCSGFPLPAARGETIEEVREWLRTTRSTMLLGVAYQVGSGAQSTPEKRVYDGMPYEPLFRAKNGTWIMWCPNLRRDGRCGDYDNRPPVCISFEAGVGGGICCHHVPRIGLCTERAVMPNFYRSGIRIELPASASDRKGDSAPKLRSLPPETKAVDAASINPSIEADHVADHHRADCVPGPSMPRRDLAAAGDIAVGVCGHGA